MNQETFKQNIFILKDEMFRFAKRFLNSTEESEDVVQELMLKFWNMKDQLATYENIKSYIMRAVKNECLNRLKHHEVKLGFVALQTGRTEYYKNEVNNLKDHILHYINELPEKQKMVIHLKDVEEYDIKEICSIMELEENAVRVNLMRARQKVKEKISKLFEYENRAL